MGTFSFAPTTSRTWNMRFNARYLIKFKVVCVGIATVISRAYMNIFSHCQSQYSLSYWIDCIGPCLTMVIIEPRLVNESWSHIQSFLAHDFWCLILDPHVTTHHLNIGVYLIRLTAWGLYNLSCSFIPVKPLLMLERALSQALHKLYWTLNFDFYAWNHNSSLLVLFFLIVLWSTTKAYIKCIFIDFKPL